MRVVALLTFLAYSVSADEVTFEEGGLCGVMSSDFLDYTFKGDYLVYGNEGCTLGDQTGCVCAPDLGDNQALSGWKWQCNGSFEFGPAEGKTCPDVVPVAKVEDAAIALGVPEVVSCDNAIHPTGRSGDPVCPYSTCDEGGDTSAICACVDVAAYGMEGEGMQWFCLHSTCDCGKEEDPDASAAPLVGGALPLALGAALFAAL